jgi:PAS domain S-box-containing protein
MSETLRVLMVEDSEDDALLVLAELRRGGFDPQYERVDTEPALLAALDRQAWDVVLSDFSMPSFNGLAAFDLLRKSGLDIPFLFVSGRIGEDRAAEAMRRGAADYILKDNLNRLTPAIQRELREAEVRRQRRQAEEQLHAAQRLLQTVFDTLPVTLAVKDTESRYRMVNRAWCERYGVAPADVIGVHSLDVPGRPEQEKRNTLAEDRKVLAGDGSPVVFEGWDTTGAGQLRHYQSIKAPIRDENGKATGLISATLDFTAQRRAEEDLRKSEERFRAIIENAQDVIVVLDAEGAYRLVSPSVQAQLGFTPAELIGQRATAFVHPEDLPRVQATLAEAMQVPGSTSRVELRQRHKDGSWRHYEVVGKNLLNTPAIGGLLGMLRDITARKRAEEELQASQRLLQTVFDTIPHHLIVKDLESRYLMVNKAWCEAFGRTPEEVLHRPTSEQSSRPPAEIARILEEDRRVFNGESLLIPMQRTLTVNTGEKRYFQGMKSPLRDGIGATVGLVGISMDITAEVEARQKADTAHARLMDAIESLPAAFYMYDPEEKLLLWNSRAGEFYPQIYALLRPGISFEEVLRIGGTNDIDDAKGRLEEWVNERLDQFRNRPGNFEQQLKNGRWVQGIDRRTSDGSTVCLRFDVTDIKQREAELRQSQKLEAIGSLAGGIAHDFNNLLTVIGSYSGFIQDAAKGQDAIRADALVIQETSERAAALTRQLLAFSRRQVLQMRVLDLNKTVGSVERMLQRLIGENIELRTSLRPDLRWIQADETQIEQIILNLAVNARDAMPRGGKLSIETANRALDASYATIHAEVTPGDYVMLAVTDTGVGMSPEVQKRIFEPFFTTKALGEGTGMGLATVYGIVKQMKGFIFVYSEPGKGTSFKIYFPESPDQVESAVRTVAAAATTGATETVLLVEDEELVRRSAARILKSAGYVVLQASDAQEALKICGSPAEKIDLLLSDVVMPGLSGRELWDQVRGVRPIRAIFMSGYTDDAIVRHGILEGEVPFLNKPFTKQTLLGKVREVLDAPLQNGKATC